MIHKKHVKVAFHGAALMSDDSRFWGDELCLWRKQPDKTFGLQGRYEKNSVDLVQRMDGIRQFIWDVRMKWRDQEGVPDEVVKLVRRLAQSAYADQILAVIAMSLNKNRDWADRLDQKADDNTQMINLYINPVTYEFFKGIRNYLSEDKEKTPEDMQDMRAITWITELINMELFWVYEDSKSEIDQRYISYRGIDLDEGQLTSYLNIADESLDIDLRGMQIPLLLQSTSFNRDKALGFIDKMRVSGSGDGLMWTNHVVTLEAGALDLYHRYYPSSVVSRLCATPVGAYSKFEKSLEEEEVLLRGAFLEALAIEKAERFGQVQVYDLHLLMVDANRDHIATYEKGEKVDKDARVLFNALVRARKYAACETLAREMSRHRMAASYETLKDQAEHDVDLQTRRLDRGEALWG